MQGPGGDFGAPMGGGGRFPEIQAAIAQVQAKMKGGEGKCLRVTLLSAVS